MKKELCLLTLLLSMCFLFTGCGIPVDSTDSNNHNDAEVNYTDVLAGLQQTVDTGLAQYTDTFEKPVLLDGRVWALGTGWVQHDAADEPMLEDVVISANTDGSEAKRLTLKMPENWTDSEEWGQLEVYPSALFPAADGSLWLLCRLAWSKTEEDTISHQEYRLTTLGADGSLTAELVPGALQDGTYIHCSTAADGVAWLLTEKELIKMDPVTGEGTSYALPVDRIYTNLQALSDGRILVLGHTLNAGIEQVGYVLDGNGDWSDQLSIPPQLSGNAPGTQMVPVLSQNGLAPDEPVIWDINGIFQWNTAAGEAVGIFSWLDSGVNPANLLQVFALDAEKFLLVSQDAAGALNFITLVPASAEVLASRTVVTVGITGDIPDLFRQAVLAFNGSNDEVFVKVVQYALSAGGEGVRQLEQDILNGEVPDIIFLSRSMSNYNYLRQGLYIDMYPLLETDPDLKQQDFVPNILSLGEFRDQLMTIPVSYHVMTTLGAADKVGTEMGWTFEDYHAAAASQPALERMYYNYDRQSFLLHTLQMGGKRFIDYEIGTARLDTPEMIDLIETSAEYPAERSNAGDAKQLLAEGHHLLYMDMTLNNFNVLREYYYIFDGDYTFVGFPGDEGCGSAILPAVRVGITSSCKEPEAAWQFVRTLLLPGFQDNLCSRAATRLNGGWNSAFPLRIDSLQKAADAAAEPFTSEDYLQLVGINTIATGSGSDYWSQGVPTEQSQKLIDLIYSITSAYQYDNVLTNILFEESDVFYNSSRSAEDTAHIIQNRVQTYLDEQG